MGATSSRMDQSEVAELQALMKLQREYVMDVGDAVNFSNPTGSEEVEEADEDDNEEEEKDANEVGEDQEIGFQHYVPRTLNLPGAGKHPSPAVENGTLSTVSPPEISYELSIVEKCPEIIRERRLSALQLEFIALCCQRHEQRLGSGSRKGFFLGDGAGMGKGRQIAGLILENILKGRHKNVWISTSHDLIEDAKRDLADVSGSCLESEALSVLSLPSNARDDIYADQGVIFTTYSMLGKGFSEKAIESGSPIRINQIITWLTDNNQAEFNGCIIFDEAHRAKNLVADRGSGTGETAAARAVFEIQRALPEARIVYCSATGVSEPHHYAYMTRLGLWGPSSPFPIADETQDESSNTAIKAFIKRVKDRGMGAMELCALHLKQEGALLCRTLSYEGVHFDIVEAELTPDQQKIYDESARLWQLIYTRSEQKLAQMMNDAWAQAGLGNPDTRDFRKARTIAHGQIWSGHQRFFRSLITSFKVPTLVRLARAALAEGKCVVIGLQSTGEAHTQRAVSARKEESSDPQFDENNDEDDELPEAGCGDDMLSAPQETLKFVVKKIWEDAIKANRDRKLEERALRKELELIRSEKLFDDESDDELFGSGTPKVDSGVKQSEPMSTDEEVEDEDSIMDCCSSASEEEDDEPAVKKPRLLWDDDEEEDDGKAKKSAAKATAAKNRHSTLFDLDDDEQWIAEIMERIQALQLPGNALDMLIDELGGTDAVAEMTGRSSRMVRNYKDEFVYEKRSANGVSANEQNIYEREEFQAGRKLVAIISDAASSGISLHAENADRVKNKRRRVHFTLELPWSADKTIQQMGRSHRSNQLVPPEYKLLVSPLGGERRFCAAVTKRLESLGALTQGDRRAAAVTKGWGCFNVDTKEGADTVLDIYYFSYWLTNEYLGQEGENDQKPLVSPPALGPIEATALAKLCIENKRTIMATDDWRGSHGDVDALAKDLNVVHAARLWLSLVGIDIADFKDISEEAAASKKDIVSKFLNRILGLEIYRQQVLFDYFARYLQKTIESAMRDGKLNRGVASVGGRKVTFRNSKPLRLITPTVTRLELLTVAVDLGFSFDDACAKLKEVSGGSNDQSTMLQQYIFRKDDRIEAKARFKNRYQQGTISEDNGDGTYNIVFDDGSLESHLAREHIRNVERFGVRDGFRMGSDKHPILIVEVGTASLRGLSVKTDEFQIFHPDKLRETLTWTKLSYRYPTALSVSAARIPWCRVFDNRPLRTENSIIVGPVLYVYANVLTAQHLEHAMAQDTIRLIRAIEHDNGNATGKSQIGILLDTKKCHQIIRRVEQAKMDDGSLADAISTEANIIDEVRNKRLGAKRGYKE